MTAALLALLLTTHVCPAVDLWTANGKDLVAKVVCAPPAATWPVGKPVIHLVLIEAARKWPMGPECTAYIRNGDVTSRVGGDLRSNDGLSLCVPWGGGGTS